MLQKATCFSAAHRARADARSPERLRDVLDPTDRDPCQGHPDGIFQMGRMSGDYLA